MRFFAAVLFFYGFYSFSQPRAVVDFTKVDAELIPSPYFRSVKGIATYDFTLLQNADSIHLDAINMVFDEVLLNGKKIKYSYTQKVLAVKAPKKRGTHRLDLKFRSEPEQTVYFVNWNSPDSLKPKKNETISNSGTWDRIEDSMKRRLFAAINSKNGQIWTQGQGKYTSHWLPSFDDMNEKLEFDLTIRVPPKYTVIANGRLESDTITGNLRSYRYDMSKPMSSYLAAFVVGDFEKKTVQSTSGVPIELYHEPKDSLKVEPTYRYTKEIFDFLEREIGVPYPWQNYKQVPVQDFLYAGMENTSCTIFSNQYVIDSTAFVDKNYVNVNAHELAHQWFGNMVTEVSGEHHWLHEGFATYYAYLSERKLFGEDYFYWRLYQTAKTLNTLSENGDGEALTNPNANSLTFYEKGAWALVMLRERLGDKAFKKGIKAYLNTYAFSNVTIADFLTKMEEASGQDLSTFRQKWLESEIFPWEPVKHFLTTQSKSLSLFFGTENGQALNTALKLYGKLSSTELQVALIKKYHDSFDEGLVRQLLANDDIKVRQAIASVTDSISDDLRPSFEALLSDRSYITKELVLYKLWEAFPDNRSQYLKALDGVIGLPNKNVRQLWLTLALVTPEFRPDAKRVFYDELNGLTAARFNFEVRQLAFQYLFQLGALNNDALKSLIRACDHHVWQFKKSSRNLVRQLYEAKGGKQRLENLNPLLSQEEKDILQKVVKP